MDAARGRSRDPLAWLAVVCAVAFCVLGAVVAGRGHAGFDDAAAAAVTGLHLPEAMWEALTWLGGTILIPLGVLLVTGLLLARRIRLAIVVAVALLLATFATDTIKELVQRPRPPGGQSASAIGYSFPSGHSLESTVTYGLIALAIWRSRLPTWLRRAAVVVGIALPFLIGLSRIALGVHFPSDVLAGWLGGIAVVAVVAVIARTPGVDPIEPSARE